MVQKKHLSQQTSGPLGNLDEYAVSWLSRDCSTLFSMRLSDTSFGDSVTKQKKTSGESEGEW